MYIFCSLSQGSLSLTQGSYFNKKLQKDKFRFWELRHKMGCWQFLTDFVNFDNICHVTLKKKFLSVVIVSVNRRRKDIKVTFVSFGLHAGMFTVECTEYGSTLFFVLTFSYKFRLILFGFKDYRIFAVSYRLAASHLFY